MIAITNIAFVFCIIFVIVGSFLMFVLLGNIIEDIKSNKAQKEKKAKPDLKIGGIYGKPRLCTQKNDPFSPIREYGYYVAILDIKPSRDGDCEYCQYVYLNDDIAPYSSYSKNTIYSNQTDKFDEWEYLKDIDLNCIKFS